jgi:hypothetical protein
MRCPRVPLSGRRFRGVRLVQPKNLPGLADQRRGNQQIDAPRHGSLESRAEYSHKVMSSDARGDAGRLQRL